MMGGLQGVQGKTNEGTWVTCALPNLIRMEDEEGKIRLAIALF